MSDTRALDAIRRLEIALARIEAAAGRPAPARDDSELSRLRESHLRLRRQVEEAIEEIDRLLEEAS